MPQSFRVLQVGLGAIGVKIAQAILERSNLELVGVVDINPDFKGKTVEQVLSLESKTKTPIFGDLRKAFKKIGEDNADVALVATSSSLERVAPTIKECIAHGLHVVSICEELSFPYGKYPQLAGEIHKLARKAKRTVVGTGINPGYLMDTLPILLSAPVQNVEAIEVTRVINSTKRRDSFQIKIGTGMTVEEFRSAINSGIITGHVGLAQSIQMIDDALNLGLDSIEEIPPEPVVASGKTVTPVATVNPGEVLGLKSVGVGRKGERVVVILNFLAYADASPEYDEVRIRGRQDLTMRIEGGVHGDMGTVAMAINMIPLAVKARPGLMTMKDLPCPRNTERIWKRK